MLKKYNLMDYSLLLAIETVEQDKVEDQKESTDEIMNFNELPAERMPDMTNSFVSNNRHRFVSKCGKFVYHMAIIDYLQTFNWDKWSESFLKTQILRRQADQISAVNPKLYGKRFCKFMKSEVILDTILELKMDDEDMKVRSSKQSDYKKRSE